MKRLIIPATGFVCVGLFALLYVYDGPLYYKLLYWLMLHPFPHPFIDWEWFPTAVSCWAQGVDVYVNNTCYTVLPGGRFNYSPLWLRATFLPAGPEWVAPFGVGMVLAFFASLACLPFPRDRRAWIVTVLATFSSLTAMGVERGNPDLILFVMIVVGVTLWNGRALDRVFGYMLFGLAGLLKFYPLVLFLLALRERVLAFLVVCLSLAVTLAVFLWAYGAETQRALSLLPTSRYFTDMFGAVNLPYGLVRAVLVIMAPGGEPTESAVATGRVVTRVLMAASVLLAVVGVAWLVRPGGIRGAVGALTQRERGFLVAGAALLVGCFFAGQSIGYRAIYLLLVLPALLRMADTLPPSPARWTLRLTCGAIVFVMWVITIQVAVYALGLNPVVPSNGSVVGMAHWILHELAWWGIITVLMSVLVAFVLDSTIYSWLRTRLYPNSVALRLREM